LLDSFVSALGEKPAADVDSSSCQAAALALSTMTHRYVSKAGTEPRTGDIDQGRRVRMRVIRAGALVCVVTAIVLSAMGRERNATASAPPPAPAAASGVPLKGDFSGSGAGTLLSASTMPTLDRRLWEVTSLSARITYASTNAFDGTTQVSGTVFVPQGKPPSGGWPIVAYGHSTTGIQSDCAPSLDSTLLNFSTPIAGLVQAGYVVVMSDYQGLGLDRWRHPYLDSTTLGYNIIDSVEATRKLVPDASNRWLAFGTSEGAQAAWAANELAPDHAGGLTLVGTVSVSPPADINGFADAAAAGTLTPDQMPVLQWILASLKDQYPDLNLDDYRRGIVADKWDVLSACRGPAAGERAKIAGQMTADDLRPSSPAAVETLRGYLEKSTLPQGPTAAPMLVMYGGNDSLIPPAWTNQALDKACQMGDVIQIQLEPDKGAADIDASAADEWINARFNGDPAQDDCPSVVADHPQ
jgi:pimeloyl-ACP methyl ester carboxylesterase